MDTISIAIGDARSSTCIVLPRGHELVRQIESLLPTAKRTVSPEPQPYPYPQMPQYGSMPAPAPRREIAMRDPASGLRQVPMPVRAPIHASQYLPGPAHVQGPPPMHEQPHRSAALIHSLLHRPTPTPTPTTTHPVSTTSAPRSMYRRGRMATAAEGSTKRCHVPGCGKISVSRGVCRGHGGGRRCQFEGCPKSAQSRGDFCWSHGGGHRCEVPGCMRSRKSKRFCKRHMNWGSARPPVREVAMAPHPTLLPRAEALPTQIATPPPPPLAFTHSPTRLPSLHQALQTQHSMIYGTGTHELSPPTSVGRPAFPTMLSNSISC